MEHVQNALPAADDEPSQWVTEPGGVPATSAISDADLLRYLGDLVEELQLLCGRTGCVTLSGLLGLARTEALLQQRLCDGQRRSA
jgi:hypothetical protein